MKPDLHALLIGIDFYLPSVSDEGAYYPSLNGCVPDVGMVEELFRTRLGVPDDHIETLTSTNREPDIAPEPPGKLPTYENMVAAFKRLTERAQPGDQVYVHYSGHGGRVRSRFEDLKGRNALDETLVPMNIGDTEARHLRDIELAHLLKTMVDKGLFVTIVLDSCHSGGATRGPGVGSGTYHAVRGTQKPDPTPRAMTSDVASDDELRATWKELTGGTTRSVKLGSGWLPEPQGYVLLAACRESELANEASFGEERHGALTYWLVHTLRQARPSQTYKSLHERIVGKVHSAFPTQTPQLHGDGSRILLASDRLQVHFAVNVLNADLSGGHVQLNTGQAQGMRKGAKFIIYPPDADLSNAKNRLAVVEIDKMGASDSRATIVERLSDEPFEAGAQAVLQDPGTITLKRRVQFAGGPGINPAAGALLEAVRERLDAEGEGFLCHADATGPVDFEIGLLDADHYEVRDPAGQPLPNLAPVPTRGGEGVSDLIRNLVHLAKFRNVLALANEDPLSPLAGKVTVELLRGHPSNLEPLADPGNTPELIVGESVVLKIRNGTNQNLNIAVLNLTPTWGVAQVYPPEGDQEYRTFNPGEEFSLGPLRVDLPGEMEQGTDVIKVFATVGPVSFRWLELPKLGQQQTRGGPVGPPANPLESLLAAVAKNSPRTRDLALTANPSAEWATDQVELRVRR